MTIEYRETCCCGARVELAGMTGAASFRIKEFRDAHAVCRERQHVHAEVAPRWADVELPALEEEHDG